MGVNRGDKEVRWAGGHISAVPAKAGPFKWMIAVSGEGGRVIMVKDQGITRWRPLVPRGGGEGETSAQGPLETAHVCVWHTM